MNLILTKTTVPNLNVAGWWDQEDYYGPVKIYETLEKNDADHKNYLVVGPWRHGGWGGDGKIAGADRFRRRSIEILSRKDRSAVVRILAEG